MNFLLLWGTSPLRQNKKFFETLEQAYAFINYVEQVLNAKGETLSFRIVSATSKTYERKQVRHGSDQVPTLQ
jgi:hypothetical protein